MKPLSSFGMALLGSGLIAITYGLARFVFGLFLPAIREEMTISATMAGVIGALPFLSFVFAILIGPWMTRYLGVRRGAALAASLACIGLVAISQASSSLVLAIGVMICGISTGLSSPVMAEAVYRVVPEALRGRVNATINAGTSVGIALAMPAVLIWAEVWRSAYTGFAALAALGAVAAFYYLPRNERPVDCLLPREEPLPGSRTQWVALGRLSSLAFLVGVVSAAYWVFAPDAVINAGSLEASQTSWMWLAVGLGGLAGGFAGDLISRLGASLSHAIGLVVMSSSLVLLALDPGYFPLVLLSSGLFGAGYMTLTGFYLVRSTQIMVQAPSLGAIFPLLATSIGQVVGSPLSGWFVGADGYAATFVNFALLGFAATGLGVWLLYGKQLGISPRTEGCSA